MSLLASLRAFRAYLLGRRDGRVLARKHASLAYLSPPAFPRQLAERFRRVMETYLTRYQRHRARWMARLVRVSHRRQGLEELVGFGERPGPEALAPPWVTWGRRGLLGAAFSAELVYNKLAMDTLELTQLEAYTAASIATLAMFWMGHQAGKELRQGNRLLALMVVVPALLGIVFALLRTEFTRRMAEINGDPPPVAWVPIALVGLGLALVALTFFLGYKSPSEWEERLREYRSLLEREKLLWTRLRELHDRARRTLALLAAQYREEVAAYWRGFARTWPEWDPTPDFLGALPALEMPQLPPPPEPPEPLEKAQARA